MNSKRDYLNVTIIIEGRFEFEVVCSVPLSGQAIVRIFNVLGKEVVRLLDEQMSPGVYRISWDGENQEGRIVPSGIYLARMLLSREAATIKLFVLK